MNDYILWRLCQNSHHKCVSLSMCKDHHNVITFWKMQRSLLDIVFKQCISKCGKLLQNEVDNLLHFIIMLNNSVLLDNRK